MWKKRLFRRFLALAVGVCVLGLAGCGAPTSSVLPSDASTEGSSQGSLPSEASQEDPSQGSLPSEAAPEDSSQGSLSSETSPDASSDASQENSSPNVPAPLNEETKRADEMVRTVLSQYGIKGDSQDVAYVNLRESYGTDQPGYLWSNFCGVGMQYYVCKLHWDDDAKKEIFRKMINNFLFFRHGSPSADQDADSVKYHSARGDKVGEGSGDCFFDDNIWVARNYLRAYELLGDEWYLEEARRVDNWVLSGWNSELGGVVWCEAGLSPGATEQQLERGLSANACSILVNARLSQLAQDPEEKEYYLNWAKRFYKFCKKMQNTPASYDYWNGIHTVYQDGEFHNGSINKIHYAYNSGNMILANLALYDCTEEGEEKDAYMEDAVRTAAAAYKTFLSHDPKTEGDYYRGDPWFAAILNEAYYELWQYGLAEASDYLDAFDQNVAYAYANRDAATGLCPYQATQKVTWDKNEAYVIHQTGFAQQAVLAALYKTGGQN